MNYTFLVIIATCLIGSGAWAYTQEQLNDYCEECIKDSSRGAVNFHPYRCDAFIICQILENGFRANEMKCPDGLFYDNNSQNCIPNHACSRPCKQGEVFAHLWDCGKYFECTTGTFASDAVYKSCSKLYRFDVTKKQCVPDGNCNPPAGCPHRAPGKIESEYIETIGGISKVVSCASGLVFSKAKCGCDKPDTCPELQPANEEYQYYEIIKTLKNCTKGHVFRKEKCGCIKLKTCSDEYKLSNTLGKYLRLVHGRWMEMSCGQGTSFNMTTCSCSDRTSNSGPIGDGCNRINVTLKYNVSDVHKSYVQNVGVTIDKQMGFFDGGDYFVLARTANVKIAAVVDIRVSFSLSKNQKGDKVALIGNGRCNKPSTFAMYIEGAKGNSPTLVVEMVVGASSTKETLKTSVAFGTWYDVKVEKTDTTAKLYLNSVQKRSLTSVGQLVKTHCAFGVGNMTSMSNYYGNMKDVYVSWCPK